MARKRRTCLVCDNKDQTRGLCLTHRDDAKALIDAGLVTDAELVEAGLMLPKKPLGRPAAKRRRKTAKPLEENAVWLKLQEITATA
jgi:hypothetical protein